MGKNPFNHKYMEKVLFAAFKHRLPAGRRTRSYLRQQARNIEHGYEIGYRDGQAGKELVPIEDLLSSEDSGLTANMMRRAYVAYRAGYRLGAEERKGA